MLVTSSIAKPTKGEGSKRLTSEPRVSVILKKMRIDQFEHLLNDWENQRTRYHPKF